MSRLPVFINLSGGTAAARGDKLEDELRIAFDAVGMDIDLHLLPGDRLASAVDRAAGAPVVVVGGGDGTLGSVAGSLAEAGSTMAILPLGTRNHLARELGIPLDLQEATELIAADTRRKIDLASINGRVFVNNASIGFYPDLVHQREGIALPKKLAAIPAAVSALKRMRHHRLRLAIRGTEKQVVTPMLFVGNNRYELEAGRLGQRAALDDGLLLVYAVARRRRLRLIGFALRTLIGRADRERDFAAVADTRSLRVTGPKDEIEVAVDGEVERFAVPLEFSVLPGALTVIAPLEPKP